LLFSKLIHASAHRLPEPRGKIDAPDRQGVYVIYSPSGRVMHVGRTPRPVAASHSAWAITCTRDCRSRTHERASGR
jgi:hypothetical protein